MYTYSDEELGRMKKSDLIMLVKRNNQFKEVVDTALVHLYEALAPKWEVEREIEDGKWTGKYNEHLAVIAGEQLQHEKEDRPRNVFVKDALVEAEEAMSFVTSSDPGEVQRQENRYLRGQLWSHEFIIDSSYIDSSYPDIYERKHGIKWDFIPSGGGNGIRSRGKWLKTDNNESEVK